MANFEGYLIKSGNDILPNHFIQYDTYNSDPNYREEIKAYRDDNTRDLYRITAEGYKTSLHFSTLPLNLEQKKAFLKFFTDHETNALERKIQITYWNDEESTYKTGYFYRPNMKFSIRKITENDIYYNPIEIGLIEY